MNIIVSEKMLELGRNRSVIRDVFEYGNLRKAQIGAENVFDFSLGNPRVPTPVVVTDMLQELIAQVSPAQLYAYTSGPSLFQQLVKGCLGKTVDISIYDENRKLLYNALTEYGFEAVYPDGAFYLFLKSPEPDAHAFCEKAK